MTDQTPDIRTRVADLIDAHEWSRLLGGSVGQQIADRLLQAGLLRQTPAPDAGDDTLREQLARTLHEADKDGAREKYGITFRAWSDLTDEVRQDYYDEVDLLLPLIRDHVAAADSPQHLFGRLISTAKGREILDENGIRGVERAEKAEAAIQRVRALHGPCNDGCPNCHECALAEPCPTIRALDGAETSHGR